MDFAYLRAVLPQYVEATWQTLQLSLWGVALSLVFGLLVCIAVVYRLPFFASVCRAYIELSRNTPLLVQLFFLYYGLPKFGIRLSGFACGVIGLDYKTNEALLLLVLGYATILLPVIAAAPWLERWVRRAAYGR